MSFDKAKDSVQEHSFAYGLSGGRAADASREAAAMQQEASREAVGLARETRDLARSDLAPFREFGQDNLANLQSILTPQGQSDYLRSNPLFQIAMDKLDRTSNNAFLGRGKLGDATAQLSNNAFLAGQPLLQRQSDNLFNAVNLGQSSAAGQANTAQRSGESINDLITGGANAGAAGLVGAANAQQQGAQNVAGIAGGLIAAFSDRRLKRNCKKVRSFGPYNIYQFQYVWSDEVFEGVMADEVKAINPDAVITHDSGYDIVIYGAL